MNPDSASSASSGPQNQHGNPVRKERGAIAAQVSLDVLVTLCRHVIDTADLKHYASVLSLPD